MLPSEFAPLMGRIANIRKVTATEWSSSCPECGGNDRFRMFTNASGRNKIFGWCRRCSFIWSPKREKSLSPAEFEQWRKQQIVEETRKKEEAEHALKNLRSEKIWEFYHANRGDYGVEFWQSRGIPKDWQDYWKLGMNGNYKVSQDYMSPAATIPMWYEDWGIENVKLRVLKPRDESERYRAVYKTGLKPRFFTARPDLKTERALVVEGEIKAMVCATQKGMDMQVIGLPSATPDATALAELKKYEVVYLCLDPDARVNTLGGKNPLTPEKRVLDIVGKDRCRLIHLHGKVDDLILGYGLSIESAIKVASAA